MEYLYMLGSVVFTVYGQMIVKARIGRYGSLPDSFTDKLMFLVKLYLDPFILSGLVAAFIASMFWMAAMTKVELSSAYPIITGGLVIITGFLSVIVFKESITYLKVMGVLLVVAGIYLISRT